jgi:uncharacterized membrane protein
LSGILIALYAIIVGGGDPLFMAQRLKKWLENLKNALIRAPEHKDVNIKLKPLSATASAGEVTVWLDQYSTILNQISGLVEETRKGVSETRKGVVLAIFVTIFTTIVLSFEPWIGLVRVITAIILIGVIVAVILILQWRR